MKPLVAVGAVLTVLAILGWVLESTVSPGAINMGMGLAVVAAAWWTMLGLALWMRNSR